MRHKLLVTGGLGNLGSWIVQYAIELFDVTVLTKNHREVKIDGDFEVIYVDLADLGALKDALSQKTFNYVIHAGSVNDGFVPGYHDLAFEVNGFGTRNLLDALDLESLSHFVYLSTFQVYGVVAGEIDEQRIPLPKNDYGLSHLLAEHFISIKMPPQKYSIIRLTNSYGCPKDLRSSKWYLVLNDLSKQAFSNHKITLSGNGNAVRDFIWMGTVAQALSQLLTTDPENETYNLSGGESMAMMDVAKKVQKAYRLYTNDNIPIELNSDDSTPKRLLVVDSEKFQRQVPIKTVDKMVEESIEIFKLLESSK